MTIHIIVDSAARFFNQGKKSVRDYLVAGIVRKINQTEHNPKVYVWNDEIFEKDNTEDFPAEGKSNVDALINFLETIQPPDAIIILSDRLWKIDDRKKLQEATQNFSFECAVVPIGADADLTPSTNRIKLFMPEDVATVAEYFVGI